VNGTNPQFFFANLIIRNSLLLVTILIVACRRLQGLRSMIPDQQFAPGPHWGTVPIPSDLRHEVVSPDFLRWNRHWCCWLLAWLSIIVTCVCIYWIVWAKSSRHHCWSALMCIHHRARVHIAFRSRKQRSIIQRLDSDDEDYYSANDIVLRRSWVLVSLMLSRMLF